MNLTSYEKGGLKTARTILLAQLERKFGTLPASVAVRIDQLPLAEIEDLAIAFVDGQSLEEMGLLDDDPE